MKFNHVILRIVSAASMAAIVLVSSCKNDDERVDAQDIAALSEEAIADAYYEDADDLSSVSIYDNEAFPGGRMSTSARKLIDDGRLGCAEISLADGSTATDGTIIIDFSHGQLGYCIHRGNRREGKIILDYEGTRGSAGFTIVQTFDSYKINGVQLKGTRTITRMETSPDTNVKHSITLVDGQAIWPDNGGTITRNATFTRLWVRPPAEDVRVQLDGSASGTTRRGRSYAMSIEETLVYRRECAVDEGIFMAVGGVKVFTTDNKVITVDYGDENCDRSVVISVNGISRQVSVDKN